jgi:nucleotide-binding universal stress UspA family protein
MRILLATDGSKDAAAATAFLRELPLPTSSKLRIVTAMSFPTFALEPPPVRDFKRSVLEDARRVVDEARATLAPRGFDIETSAVIGSPKDEIPRIAGEWNADLVVLGARGLGRVKRFLLGSVSLAVARRVSCPVLVVKGRARKLASILVGMDGSEDSFQALRFLLSLPLARQTKLRLLSVVEPIRYPTSAPGAVRGHLARMLKEVENERRGELEKVLDKAAAQLEGSLTRVTRSTPTGNPADVIVAVAAAHDADLVVVGARGLGGMTRLLLGSVSEKVLGYARCPVLIVKERSQD